MFETSNNATMVLPDFTLSQTSDTLTITVQAPFCNLAQLDADIYDGDCFIFECFPYFLRVVLPGRVTEGCDGSTFDADSGEFKFVYTKQHPGEEFKDLDVYSKLLVEPQRPVYKSNSEKNLFGFAMQGNGRFCGVADEFMDMFDVDPMKVELKKRTLYRFEKEQKKFSPQHYLFDLADEHGEIAKIIAQTPPWNELTADELEYGPEVLNFMKNHPRKQYDLTPEEITYCHNGLLDILFAYCYDRRTTYFEGTCESSWTILKLSATLSCFDGFEYPRQAMMSAFRRCLTYPLYRNFTLAQTVFEDLKSMLRLKENYIVKCLLDIYDIFLNGGRYVLNSLFIIDYIFYVMQWDQELWEKTVKELDKVIITKPRLSLNLQLIEDCASGNSAREIIKIASDGDSDDE